MKCWFQILRFFFGGLGRVSGYHISVDNRTIGFVLQVARGNYPIDNLGADNRQRTTAELDVPDVFVTALEVLEVFVGNDIGGNVCDARSIFLLVPSDADGLELSARRSIAPLR